LGCQVLPPAAPRLRLQQRLQPLLRLPLLLLVNPWLTSTQRRSKLCTW
jgi:hypothetical protein